MEKLDACYRMFCSLLLIYDIPAFSHEDDAGDIFDDIEVPGIFLKLSRTWRGKE